MSLKDNYFKMFEMKEVYEYDIDRDHIYVKFLELSKENHPDVANNDDEEEFYEVNKAYETLKNNLLRAEYILILRNVKIEEYKDDSFNEYIFKLNEKLDSLKYKDPMTIFINELKEIQSEELKKFEKIYLTDTEKSLKHFILAKFLDQIIHRGNELLFKNWSY